jgi:diaminohydroxyphosphoribosylaminopyrimidine deaminase / 5-amino-6-(5-phosphoribosylamino)uracil reductase
MPRSLEISELAGRDEWHLANEQCRPFIVYKFAATLDGRVPAADGSSRWITSEVSRAEVHRSVRLAMPWSSASGTQLTTRALTRAARRANPPRVVVDSRARTPAGARVLEGPAPTLIAVAQDADARHLDGLADVLRLPRAERGLDLHALLEGSFARGVRAAFLEGGPTLAGCFVEAGLVDRVINYIAPAHSPRAPDGNAGRTRRLNRPGFDGDSISWRMESDGNNVEASVTEAIPGRAS